MSTVSADKSVRYRVRFPEKCRAAAKKWREKNIERARAYGRDYIKRKWQDPEWRKLIAASKRRAYQDNPDHRLIRKQSNSRWNTSEKGRHYLRMYEHVHRRGDRHGLLSYEQWRAILKDQHNRCALCAAEFSDVLRPQRDHIIPFSKGGKLILGNVQALCKPCNTRKGNKHVEAC